MKLKWTLTAILGIKFYMLSNRMSVKKYHEHFHVHALIVHISLCLPDQI